MSPTSGNTTRDGRPVSAVPAQTGRPSLVPHANLRAKPRPIWKVDPRSRVPISDLLQKFSAHQEPLVCGATSSGVCQTSRSGLAKPMSGAVWQARQVALMAKPVAKAC